MNKYKFINGVIECECGIKNCDHWKKCAYCENNIIAYKTAYIDDNYIFCGKQCHDNYYEFLSND